MVRGGRGAAAPCICLRAVEMMLLTTPTMMRTTQTSVATSRIAADYFCGRPGGGGCCESVELSAETPIDERISVSA